ncbi:F-box protein CPR1-like [Rhododendron vialii]|uniref:F-box protein CPR1-like n=1 Tax=Rhododendron vialii TaxID=182163 RepID=UPI00265DE144|nr:F-box protein CPR1-like [Rhododendron vialii]
MNQKLVLYSYTSHSVYSFDYQAPDHAIAKLEVPCKSNVEILGSFNGIVLLRIGVELCLWNPSIRMCRKFSQPEYSRGARTYGLGYDSVNDDFKVVWAVIDDLSNAPRGVHVFTCKLSSWKWIEDLNTASRNFGRWWLCEKAFAASVCLCYARDGEVVVVLDWEVLAIYRRNEFFSVYIPQT